jgi:hypothetical protein
MMSNVGVNAEGKRFLILILNGEEFRHLTVEGVLLYELPIARVSGDVPIADVFIVAADTVDEAEAKLAACGFRFRHLPRGLSS